MTLTNIMSLLFCSVCLALGQFLFKRAAISTADGEFYQVLLSPYLWGALFVYGCTTLLWVYLLRTIDLSRAYPFMALSFIIVPLVATVFLNESQGFQYWIGLALVVVGIALTTM